MALIKCPECGREKVSDSAEACPACGFGVRRYIETEKRRKEKEERERLEREKRVAHIKMPEKPENKMESNEKGLLYFGIFMLTMAVIFFALFGFDALGATIIAGGEGIILIIIAFKQKNDKYYKAWLEYHSALEDFEKYQDKILKQEQEERAKRTYESLNQLTCPRCGSANTIRIGTINRAISVSTFGLASETIGKQYKCVNCKHLW